MTLLRFRSTLLCLPAMLFLLSVPGSAKEFAERTQFGRDIRIEATDKSGDIFCMNCSVYVRGQVRGDIATIHGKVVLEEGASVSGDVASILGDIRLADGSNIGGDVAAVGGYVRRQPAAVVGGDTASMGGMGWILLLTLPPLFFLGAIVALIIWLVQRGQRRVPAAAQAPLR